MVFCAPLRSVNVAWTEVDRASRYGSTSGKGSCAVPMKFALFTGEFERLRPVDVSCNCTANCPVEVPTTQIHSKSESYWICRTLGAVAFAARVTLGKT